MNAKPVFARPCFLLCFIAALLSAVISAGLLAAVSGLFHSDGIPFGKVVAAERACRNRVFVSEREECVRRELGGPIRAMIASEPCGSQRAPVDVAAKGQTQPLQFNLGVIRPWHSINESALLRPCPSC